MLHRVILSSDANPKFLEFWPVVAPVWKKLFNVNVHLALVGDFSHVNLKPFWEHGMITVFPAVPFVPICNQAKLARYFLAAALGDGQITMTNDLDFLPLTRRYTKSLLADRPAGTLVTVGAELYTGQEAGKFTAGYLTAEAAVFRELVNPNVLNWEKFIQSFIGLKKFDHKEDVLISTHHEHPDTFSDESLLRYLLWANPVPVMHKPRGYSPYTERAVCRSDWRIDPTKLETEYYVEAHLLRPYSEHREAIQPLLDHIKTL